MKNLYIFALITMPALSLLSPAPAVSEPLPMGCHCFKQREYNPRAKFLADPYVLTTSFNSMLSRAHGLSKGQIIMMRMRQGVTAEDLITSLHIARVVGKDFQQLLFGRKQGRNWSELITNNENHQDPVLTAIREKKPDQLIAGLATDQLISSYFDLKMARVSELGSQGLTAKEITLAAGLSRKQDKPLDSIIQQVKSDGQSWGEVAAGFGYIGKVVGALIESLKKN